MLCKHLAYLIVDCQLCFRLMHINSYIRKYVNIYFRVTTSTHSRISMDIFVSSTANCWPNFRVDYINISWEQETWLLRSKESASNDKLNMIGVIIWLGNFRIRIRSLLIEFNNIVFSYETLHISIPYKNIQHLEYDLQDNTYTI